MPHMRPTGALICAFATGACAVRELLALGQNTG